ncbi:S24/S26 family peptidase [Thermococcus sp. Bubb.Bath]|uniref:S24/S26 family peptidase n=1 Tax=Thermococcus sp. Bubb.Bath TaxID=1638242 RepID=UPI001438A47C|nr:S24/S26 family peptidase [Thermococcus sp. Bubb.Bath]NJF25455.1 hypothetical protein [Thermococcus sp. Bubb.Bath]
MGLISHGSSENVLRSANIAFLAGAGVGLLFSYWRIILPQGLPELFALATVMGTIALILFALWSLFIWKYEEGDTRVNLLLRMLLRIGSSAALSLFLFLIAANFEYSNHLYLAGKTSKPPFWYTLVYIGDGLLITASLLTLLDAFVFERLHASWLYDRFFFPFLFTFTVLNGPAPFDSTTKLTILGSFSVSVFVLTRHTVQSILIYLLRPRNFLDFKLSTVQGTSMNPTIFEGDVVLISKKVPEELKPGMVLDVRIPARYMSRAGNFVHRLVWTDGRTIQTNGDNLRHLDPKIPMRNVEGIALAVLRWDGKSFGVEPLVDEPIDVPPQAFQVADELVRLYQSVKSKLRFLGLYLPLLIVALFSLPLIALLGAP